MDINEDINLWIMIIDKFEKLIKVQFSKIKTEINEILFRFLKLF